MSDTSTGRDPDAGRYEIRLKGHLDSRWAAWFDGLSLTKDSDGTTVVSGLVADQAALHGLLQSVRDVGMPLVSVTQVSPDQPDVPAIAPATHRSPANPANPAKEKRHDHHRPNHGTEASPDETGPDGLPEEDLARRGRALHPDLHLDPDPLPVRAGAERSELHRRRRTGHARHHRRHPGGDRGPGRRRHRRRAVPGDQAAERGSRAGLRRLADSGGRRDRRRRRQPAVGGDAAPGRSRSGRDGHRPGAGQLLQLVLPARPEPDAGSERPAAGLAAVPVPPGPPNSSPGGTDRSAPAARLRYRRPVRPVGPDLRSVGDPGHPDRGLGVLAGRLPGRQRLQALTRHRGNGRGRHHPPNAQN